MSKILVIDDEISILENIKFILELENYEVLTADGGEKGIEVFKKDIASIEAIITDMKMPQLSGIDVLRKIKSINPEISVIILTGHGDMENAITSMKEGAFDYLNKPVKADKLLITLENAINKTKLIKENKRLQDDLVKKNEYLQGLHNAAQKILLNLAPDKLPNIPNFRFASEYKSCDKVGGDMYDVFEVGDHIGFYVFDVCSHGILASVITMILKTFLENAKYNSTLENSYASDMFIKLIRNLNLELYANTGNNIFATLFMGYINKNDHTMNYISAGHIDQLALINNEITPLKSTATMLGLFEEAEFQIETLKLSKGTKLLLFTDGITEVWNKDKMFGNENIIEILKNTSPFDITSTLNTLTDALYSYAEGSLDDDVTILGIELL